MKACISNRECIVAHCAYGAEMGTEPKPNPATFFGSGLGFEFLGKPDPV